MAYRLTEPEVIERGPYCVVGVYATIEGDNEDPAWGAASTGYYSRAGEVRNRIGDAVLGFLYRPHRDDLSIPEATRACFVGVEVADFSQAPEGMATTRFSGGKFVTVQSSGDTEMDAAMGVGEAVATLEAWAKQHGFDEGDSCFCFSHEGRPKPPYVEHVQMKIEARNA